MNKQTTPSLLKGHPYRKHDQGVDVRDTWRKFGWQPSSQARAQQTSSGSKKGDGK